MSSMKKIEEMCVGICLDCIRSKPCRAPHSHKWADTAIVVDLGDEDEGNLVGSTPQYNIFDDADYPGYWDAAW